MAQVAMSIDGRTNRDGVMKGSLCGLPAIATATAELTRNMNLSSRPYHMSNNRTSTHWNVSRVTPVPA